MNYFIKLLLLISSSLLLENASSFSSPVMMVATLSPPATTPVATTKANNKIPRGVHAPIRTLTCPEDLSDFLLNAENDDDRIGVVKYHASWCKTCHRMKPKFQQFVNEHGDWYQGQERFARSEENRELFQAGRFRFASMEVSASTKELFEAMNINQLPFVHLYSAGGQQLSGFPVGGKRFAQLKEQLDYYEQERLGQPPLPSSITPITDTIFTPELLQQLIQNLNNPADEKEDEYYEDAYGMDAATEFDL